MEPVLFDLDPADDSVLWSIKKTCQRLGVCRVTVWKKTKTVTSPEFMSTAVTWSWRKASETSSAGRSPRPNKRKSVEAWILMRSL